MCAFKYALSNSNVESTFFILFQIGSINSYPFKLQLLTHPYSWTENGYENINNFAKLIKERDKEMKLDMKTETRSFPEELL